MRVYGLCARPTNNKQVLKIAKHCKDALPRPSSGAILGLDQKGVLEITHSFPGISVGAQGHSEEGLTYEDPESLAMDQQYQVRAWVHIVAFTTTPHHITSHPAHLTSPRLLPPTGRWT